MKNEILNKNGILSKIEEDFGLECVDWLDDNEFAFKFEDRFAIITIGENERSYIMMLGSTKMDLTPVFVKSVLLKCDITNLKAIHNKKPESFCGDLFVNEFIRCLNELKKLI